jgi:hypothetical protein
MGLVQVGMLPGRLLEPKAFAAEKKTCGVGDFSI